MSIANFIIIIIIIIIIFTVKPRFMVTWLIWTVYFACKERKSDFL